MQCVILAAGKGTRLLPLTENQPKQLVSVNNRPVIEHICERLPAVVTEIVFVVGSDWRGEKIKNHCGSEYAGRTVQYVEQMEATGTAHALRLAAPLLQDRFLFLFGDDFHGQADVERALEYERALLVSAVDEPAKFGIVTKHTDGTLATMIEKPVDPPSNLASTGAMVLDQRIFDYEPETPINGEYYLTEVIERYARDYPVQIVEQSEWIPIGYPEDVKKAESLLS